MCLKICLKKQANPSLKLSEVIDSAFKEEILGLLDVLRNLKEDKKISKEKLENFMLKTGVDSHEVSKNYLKNKLFNKVSGDPAVRKIPIRTTTIQSSKGLSDEYVFITHFDDKYFIRDKKKIDPTNQEICNLLVALTRAKKRIYLVSSDNKNVPIFLKWIKPERIKKL